MKGLERVEFTDGGLGERFVAVLGEIDVAAESHPVIFDGGGGDFAAGNGRRSADGERVRVGAFEVEGQTGLGIDEQAGAAHDDLIEHARVAGVHRAQEAGVGGAVHFADAVVNEALGKIADAIGEAVLIAIGDFVGNADVEFRLGGVDAIVETFQARSEHALRWSQNRKTHLVERRSAARRRTAREGRRLRRQRRWWQRWLRRPERERRGETSRSRAFSETKYLVLHRWLNWGRPAFVPSWRKSPLRFQERAGARRCGFTDQAPRAT